MGRPILYVKHRLIIEKDKLCFLMLRVAWACLFALYETNYLPPHRFYALSLYVQIYPHLGTERRDHTFISKPFPLETSGGLVR